MTWPDAASTVAPGVGARRPAEADPVRLWGQLLAKLKGLLADLSPDMSELELLAWRIKSRRYPAGTVIAKQRARPDFWGFVASGHVAVLPVRKGWWSLPKRRRRPAELLPPGSTFGEMILADGQRSVETLRAATDVEIYALQRSDLMQVLGRRRLPALGRARSRRWSALAWAALVTCMVVVGIVLGVVQRPGSRDRQSAEPAAPAFPSSPIWIEFPQHGQIIQASAGTMVRAVIRAPGMSHATLQVDGMDVGTQMQTVSATPWTAEWTWEVLDEGSHVLVVQSRGQGGASAASTPVRVMVVPAGELVFSRNCGGQQAIYSMGSDGTGEEQLTTGPGSPGQPDVAANGVLAFVTESTAGEPRINTLEPGSREAALLTAGRDPAWSPDGGRLAYSDDGAGISQVHLFAIEGGTRVRLTAEEEYAGQPAWSADGLHLAYVAARKGNLDIWVADLEQGVLSRLTDDPAMDWAPAWSPDGTQLAFVSNRSGMHQVYVTDARGRNVRQVTEMSQGAESPAWSPTGDWLAFVAYTGSGAGVNAREIYLMSADGRASAQLTHNACDDAHPTWRSRP